MNMDRSFEPTMLGECERTGKYFVGTPDGDILVTSACVPQNPVMVAGDITTVEIPVMRKDYEHNPFTIYEPEKPILLDVLLGTKHVPIKKLFLFNGQDVYTIEAGHDIVSGTWFLKQASFRRVCSVDDFLDGTYFTQTSA